MILVLILTIT